MDEQVYEIREGVRRAKAAALCGRETISAQADGSHEIIHVALRNLRSPKTIIEDNGPCGGDWGVIYRMTQRGEYLPPIAIAPGTQGIPLAAVEVAEDELEIFRQRYSGDA